MKIRWTRESVRFRITPTELQAILAGEVVREDLLLPDGGTWAVQVGPAEGDTSLSSEGPMLMAALSRQDRARLADPEAEGIYLQHVSDISLRYLIEKDFPCIHPRAIHAAEPATETFSPPLGFEDRKR